LFALGAGCVNVDLQLPIANCPIAHQLSQTTRYGMGAVATDNIAIFQLSIFRLDPDLRPIGNRQSAIQKGLFQ